MLDAPELSREDIVAEVARLHRGAPQHIVLLGQATPGEVNVELNGSLVRYRVASASSELALREVLAGASKMPTAAVIDFAVDLPLDIECRISGHRVHIPDRSSRLARKLCPNPQLRMEVSSELLQSVIGKALLAGAKQQPVAVTGTTLGVDTAWRSFLAASAGLPADLPLNLDRLLGFAATTPANTSLADEFKRFDGLRGAFETWLKERAGTPGLQAWQAWEQDKGLAVAAAAVILEAALPLLPNDEFLKGWLAVPLLQAGLVAVPVSDHREWAEAASTLLHRSRDQPLFKQLVQAADQLIQSPEVRQRLASVSRFLPSAFDLQQEALATTLDNARLHPTAERFEQARTQLAQLRNHWKGNDDSHRERLTRAQTAVRLLGWMLSEVPAAEGPLHLQAGRLAAWFAREGGFVDLARRQLRGTAGSPLDDAMARLLAAIDKKRDELDATFAKAAVAWQQAGRAIGAALPIERALDRLAANFLNQRKDRRLMVVVLDGASWSVVAELLLDMQGREWSPLRWRAPDFEVSGAVPMLADLPTLTDVSRAALFQGARIAPGPKAATHKDVERFAHHAGLSAIVTRAGGPQLLLKADLQTSDGKLSSKARELVAGPDRVAACVLNAFDDDLDGSVQIRTRYVVDDVPLLGHVLQAAFEANRAVLLVADHGHVPGDRMKYHASTSIAGGHRWRALQPGDVASASEVVVGKDVAWTPQGCDRVALLCLETERYSANASGGEHGGISLAEMVAPAILVGDPELERRAADDGTADPDLALQAAYVPSWWRLALEPATNVTAVVAWTAVKGKPKAALSLPLGPVDASATSAASSAVAEASGMGEWSTLLLQSEVLKALPAHQQKTLREKVLPWVEVLAAAGGRMSADRFAQAANLLPTRVQGAVSTMGELLGIDGYQPVSYDAATQQVVLSQDVLRQLYVG